MAITVNTFFCLCMLQTLFGRLHPWLTNAKWKFRCSMKTNTTSSRRNTDQKESGAGLKSSSASTGLCCANMNGSPDFMKPIPMRSAITDCPCTAHRARTARNPIEARKRDSVQPVGIGPVSQIHSPTCGRKAISPSPAPPRLPAAARPSVRVFGPRRRLRTLPRSTPLPSAPRTASKPSAPR